MPDAVCPPHHWVLGALVEVNPVTRIHMRAARCKLCGADDRKKEREHMDLDAEALHSVADRLPS